MTVNSETGAELLSRLGTVETENMPELFSGFSTGRVIEVSGKSGSGKSELLYFWTVNILLPKTWKSVNLGGENGAVIFIDCNLQFNIFKLMTAMNTKIVERCKVANIATPASSERKAFVKSCLSNLHILRCRNSEQLLVTLLGFNDLPLPQKTAALLIIDGITSFYWLDRMMKMDQAWRLEEHYSSFVKALTKILDEHKLILVATRQLLLKAEDSRPFTTKPEMVFREYDPLGKLWQKSVTCQVWLQKDRVVNGSTHIDLYVLKNEFCKVMHAVINDCGFSIKD